MIRNLILGVLVIITIFTSGCALNNKNNQNEKSEAVKEISFDNDIASGVAKGYMSALSNGDIEGMRTLAESDLAKGLIMEPDENLKVTGIRLEESAQKGLNALYKYTVSKGRVGEPIASLETYYLKVRKENDKYKVSSVKSVLDYEVFKAQSNLKMRTDDKVEVNNITKLKNIPNLVYTKGNKGDVAKVKVPKDDYGTVGISFNGQKVAVSTVKDYMTYICIIEVDDAKPTLAKGTATDVNPEQKQDAIEDLVEDEDKLIGKKIITLDVYDNVKVTNFIFTKDDTHVVANYNKDHSKRFNFYECGGDLIDLKLGDIFAENKYNLIFDDYKDQTVFFNVEGVKNVSGVDQSLLGGYKISVKDFKLTKL